jgi:hypothetical protein
VVGDLRPPNEDVIHEDGTNLEQDNDDDDDDTIVGQQQLPRIIIVSVCSNFLDCDEKPSTYQVVHITTGSTVFN